ISNAGAIFSMLCGTSWKSGKPMSRPKPEPFSFKMRDHDLKNIVKKLKPVLGTKADALWNSYATSETTRATREAEALIHIRTIKSLSANVGDGPVLLPPPSAEAAAGEFLLGTIYYGRRPRFPLCLRRENLIKHLSITATTGAGKTNLAQVLLL